MAKFFLRFCSIATLIIFIQSPALAGLVFTINSTDKQTGESLGSMEILVEGPLLKMTFLDSGSQRVEVTRDIEHIPELTIVDEADSALDASSSSANASASDDASVITNTNTSENANDSEMIYRANSREMVMVDHDNEEYFVFDEDFLATIKDNFGDVAEQFSEANGFIQQAYETARAQFDAQGLSPQERAAAEQLLKNTLGIPDSPTPSGPASLDLIQGNKENINGYPAVLYELFLGGEKTKELWVTDWKDLGAGAKAQETFESYFDFFAAISDGFDELGFGSDSGLNFFEAMDQIGGFPVAGKDFEAGEVDEEWSLESITERDLDPDAFIPPPGYRLRTMGGFFQ